MPSEKSRQPAADIADRGGQSLESEVTALRAELASANARLRSVLDSAVDGIIVIDASARVETFNRGAERLFGYSESEVVGRNVSMLMPSPYREEHDGYVARYQVTGTARIIGIGREVTGRRRDGTTFPLHLSVGEVTTEGSRRFIGILHDLSARVAVEAKLREQTALVRLGEMAAVIAHEVRNPLAGVRGAIQVIGARLPAESRDATMIAEIVARIDALDQLVKDLLVFARPPRPTPAAVDVKGLVAVTASLLGQDPALGGVTVTIEGTSPSITADAEMLKIVFHNLMLNGAQAMGGRGVLRVELHGDGSVCRVTFTDHGPGIPAELREKIFTPFFTTKTRGSGLGLPMAKRFVEAHRGQIAVGCPPGGGTIITVDLPAQPF